MTQYLFEIMDYSEVWALFIPLYWFFRNPKQPKWMMPVIVYLWAALLINSMIVIGHKYPLYCHKIFHPNGYLYNIHSIVRYTCFFWFFVWIKEPFTVQYKTLLPVISFAFVVIIFVFFDRFNDQSFSSKLLSTEAGLLLVYCLQFYLFKLNTDTDETDKKDFWIVTGLSIYVLYNFFCFLFFNHLYNLKYEKLVFNMWYVHNATFIILCVFIAKSINIGNKK